MAVEYFDSLEIMPLKKRQEYIDTKLRQTVANAYQKAPVVREMMDAAGVKPEDIKGFKDLPKIPIIRKADIIERQRRFPPYGGLLAIPPEEVERVFLSPGPVYEPLQFSSIKWFARSFYAAGFRKGDIIVNTFTYHMSPAGMLFHEAIRHCGATAVPMGTGHTEIQAKTLCDLKVNGFVGTPSFLVAVFQKAEEMGYKIGQDIVLEKAWFTGEMLTPSMRKTLEEKYGLATSQAYAVTEPGGALAYECSEKNGMHFMDEYVIEIIDPDTGAQLGPVQVGEVVVTPIHNPAWGLIRFGTGDISSYTDEPCPCGRTASRLTAILGRTGDSVKVRGMFVVGRQAAQVFAGFPEIAAFQVVVERPAQRDEMTFKIELKDDVADKESLKTAVNKRFQEVCLLRADAIDFVPVGSIGEDEKKVLDQRRWD